MMKPFRIVFLHHSTGECIWNGSRVTSISESVSKISSRLSNLFYKKPALPSLFRKYNKESNKNFQIRHIVFPKSSVYGWNNYPYDYYNIWVKNAGSKPFLEEPTLEILTREYNLIIFKHCFPVSNVQPDNEVSDVNSDYKSISNYKLQYQALKLKLSEFPGTKFLLFTGAANVKSRTTEDEALRAKEFFDWVAKEWDLPDDNIFIWDLFNIQTEGGLYFRDNYARSPVDSHPGDDFSDHLSLLLFNRIVDIITTNGCKTTLTGELI
jgi:hypothetical protein